MRPIVRPALLIVLSLLAGTARAENPFVRFRTILGVFDVELCQEVSARCPGAAPISVANFLAYVDADRYPATSFIHRRGQGPPTGSPLVIQGGGYYIGDVSGSPGVLVVTPFDPIALEVGTGLSNLRGTIAMARSDALDSATSQWFINLVDNVSLDTVGGGYAVFGQVTDDAGIAVVDAIGALVIYDAGGAFTELPLTQDPGSAPSVIPYLVYVTSVQHFVPEPGAALSSAVALGALAVLTKRRA